MCGIYQHVCLCFYACHGRCVPFGQIKRKPQLKHKTTKHSVNVMCVSVCVHVYTSNISLSFHSFFISFYFFLFGMLSFVKITRAHNQFELVASELCFWQLCPVAVSEHDGISTQQCYSTHLTKAIPYASLSGALRSSSLCTQTEPTRQATPIWEFEPSRRLSGQRSVVDVDVVINPRPCSQLRLSVISALTQRLNAPQSPLELGAQQPQPRIHKANESVVRKPAHQWTSRATFQCCQLGLGSPNSQFQDQPLKLKKELKQLKTWLK